MSKRKQHFYKDVKVDSQEESQFYAWCEEAKEHSLILDFSYHPEHFITCEGICTSHTVVSQKVLKTKTNTIEKTYRDWIVKSHKYQPDFTIKPKYPELFPNFFFHRSDIPEIKNEGIAYLDTKGSFMQMNGNERFELKKAMVYNKYGIVVEKVVPKEFFKLTWVPEFCKYTEKRRDLCSTFIGCRSVQQFIEEVIKPKYF